MSRIKQTRSFVMTPKAIERMENLIKVLNISRSVLIEEAIMQFDERVLKDVRTPNETLAELKLSAIERVLNGEQFHFISDKTDAIKVSLIKQLLKEEATSNA